MGIIKATADAVKGALSDSWLEVYEADDMGDQVVLPRVSGSAGDRTKREVRMPYPTVPSSTSTQVSS